MNNSLMAQTIIEEMLERDWRLSDLVGASGSDDAHELQVRFLALHMFLVTDDPNLLWDEKDCGWLSQAFGTSEEFFVNMARNNRAPDPDPAPSRSEA